MTQADAVPPAKKTIPKVRRPPAGADPGALPRHWFGGVALFTHVSNGVNLLFPAGERFFVRSVRHFEARLDDPRLRAEVRAFYGQEGSHTKAHEDVIERLREQGYEVDRFLRFYEWLAYGVIERLSTPALRLAATAAAEHFTAIMAEDALERRVLDAAHPAMRELLLWHAAEEIEHRAVAFDVLAQVAPGYLTRMGGLAYATVTLAGFWALGTAMLLRQEEAPLRELLAAAKAARGDDDRQIARDVFWAGIKDYARPGFHPDHRGNAGLAQAYLASAGA
ncbi:MAG: metal-dependent hydrolase [Polyangiaceae bacterium]|nr:metal-dependent hydrolase [Polyangiaceae bacterium]